MASDYVGCVATAFFVGVDLFYSTAPSSLATRRKSLSAAMDRLYSPGAGFILANSALFVVLFTHGNEKIMCCRFAARGGSGPCGFGVSGQA